tara:strand:+ start:830 stop:1120 length:291 start_codon:yes stop_codon:yes gene_type:complete
MNPIDEQPESDEEIKKLEIELNQEILHSLNEIDTQILNLLVQRKTTYSLYTNYNNTKFDTILEPTNLIQNINSRIYNNYDNDPILKKIFHLIINLG